ncbi:hypothetical protein BH10PSE3_BH10PSE3_10840 [soil metagenome]
MHIVFTIVSRNYAAQASALMKSLGEVDPDVHRVVIVTDGVLQSGLAGAEVVDVWSIDGITPAMALYYDALEFNTAVKPFAFKHLLSRPGARTVVYLDPDILVFRPLMAVRVALEGASISLTPHMTRPLGSSGTPTDQTILQAGAYNLGFMGASPRPDTIELMDWWVDKCRFDCRVDFANGLFTDQKWMDLAPGLVESFALLRDPDLNLAYWNLPHRRLEQDDGRWVVDGRPLTFFHFSGFDPTRADQLSRYQTHVRVERDGPLANLLTLYARTLTDHGHRRSSETPYGHASLQDGRTMTPLMRKAALEAVRRGERLERPARQAGAWFDMESPDAPALTRLAATWIRKAGYDLRSDDSVAEGMKAFRRTADIEAIQGQDRLEQTGSGAVRDPMAVWPFASERLKAAKQDPLEWLREDEVGGISRATLALWRCRADLRDRFERDDPDLLAWCLGPEAIAGRFVSTLLSDERKAALDLREDGLLDRAAGFVLGEAERNDIREIQALFGVAVRAGWPIAADLQARRDRWAAKDPTTGLPAMLVALWEARTDLRMRLNLRRRLDRVRFLRWFASTGLAEYRLVPAALPLAITANLAFRSAWRPDPGRDRGHEVEEVRILDLDDEVRSAVHFIAATQTFTHAGVRCATPARAKRVTVETLPGAAAADLIALRAAGTKFEVVEARWPAAVVEALNPDDPIRGIIRVIHSI